MFIRWLWQLFTQEQRGRATAHHWCTSPCSHATSPNTLGSSSPRGPSASLLYWLMELSHRAECHSLTRHSLANSERIPLYDRGAQGKVFSLALSTTGSRQKGSDADIKQHMYILWNESLHLKAVYVSQRWKVVWAVWSYFKIEHVNHCTIHSPVAQCSRVLGHQERDWCHVISRWNKTAQL